MFSNVLVFYLVYLSVLECASDSTINKYVGKTYSVEEFNKLDICYSKICVKDVGRLRSYVSHSNDSDPCVNFDEFACGYFYKHRTTNYGYGLTAFNTDLIALYNDKLKTILKQKIVEDEPNVFKFVKMYYQKCVVSDYGSEEISGFQSFMNEFGKYPYYDDNWKPSEFGTLYNSIMDEKIEEEWVRIWHKVDGNWKPSDYSSLYNSNITDEEWIRMRHSIDGQWNPSKFGFLYNRNRTDEEWNRIRLSIDGYWKPSKFSFLYNSNRTDEEWNLIRSIFDYNRLPLYFDTLYNSNRTDEEWNRIRHSTNGNWKPSEFGTLNNSNRTDEEWNRIGHSTNGNWMPFLFGTLYNSNRTKEEWNRIKHSIDNNWKPSEFGTLNNSNRKDEEWNQIMHSIDDKLKPFYFGPFYRGNNRKPRPPFVDNWKPSDFNLTKALILKHKFIFKTFLKESSDTVIVIDMKINFNSEIYHGERNGMELPCELSDYLYDDCEGENKITTIEDLDSYVNITSGLDWLHIFKGIYKEKDINNKTEVFMYYIDKNDMKIFDLKNRRTLAHIFMKYLYSKRDFHALFPKPEKKHYRYGICIENLMRFFKFPLEIMFQLKHGKETTIKAFKEFHEKFNLVENGGNKTIQVGYPDELTTPEVLNIVYRGLQVGENYELSELHQIILEFNFKLFREKSHPISTTNVSENAKEIFKKCGFFERKTFQAEYRKPKNVFDGYLLEFEPVEMVKPEGTTDFNEHYKTYDYSYDFDKHFPCHGLDKTLVYKVKDTLYPLFNPDRPYYVNLAYYAYKKGNHELINYQEHYAKYVEQFGPEKNLPNFLMTNQQMFEVIRYQSNCFKDQNGNPGGNNSPRNGVFNCQDSK